MEVHVMYMESKKMFSALHPALNQPNFIDNDV